MMGNHWDRLQAFEDVHAFLADGGKWSTTVGGPETPEEWSRLRRYGGLLEQINIWYRHKIIDAKTMDSTFSHRIVRFYNSDAVWGHLMGEEQRRHWVMLKALADVLKEQPSFSARITDNVAARPESLR